MSERTEDKVITLTYGDWVYLNQVIDKDYIKWVTSIDDPYLLGWMRTAPGSEWLMFRLPELERKEE